MSIASIDKRLKTGWQAIDQSGLKQGVKLLASDQMRGRLSLDKGDAKAIEWIVSQFKNAGLVPVDGSYLQAVPLIEYIPDRQNTYLQLDNTSKQTKWKKPDVFTEFHQNVTLTGDIVFAGYGITAPALHYDDYANIDVKGKVVLVFEHEPQERDEHSIFNGKANTIYATNRIKALNAQQHGAIAIIIAPEPNRQHPSNQERYKRIGGSTARKVPLPSQTRENDELQIPVAVISDKVANQIAGTDLSLAKLQAAIDEDLKPHSIQIANKKITLHAQNKSRKTDTSYNVVGLLPGSDPALKEETIIISAHHDHDGISRGEIWHGADDNASGTAGVVSLAHALQANIRAVDGEPLKRSILFVVFAAEERGLLGAYFMADHPVRPLETTRAMINFDMIGRNEKQSTQTKGIIDVPKSTANRLNLIGGHYSPDYEKVIRQQNAFVGLDLDTRFDNEPALNVFFRSDQFPFVLRQIPAFWWFTGFHPDYHHTSDTADKINYAKMQKILRLAYLTTYDFANTATPPQFVENPGIT